MHWNESKTYPQELLHSSSISRLLVPFMKLSDALSLLSILMGFKIQ